jgi:homogentisate 1,2-dioxygenase
MIMNINTSPDAIVRSSAQLTPGYLSGFGNSFETEALPGALPMGRNSPQRCAYGLYAEQLSGSPFTAPRGSNERSWLYRIRPSVKHSGRFAKADAGLWRTAPCHEYELPIAQLRWDPAPIPKKDMTFLQGVQTMTTAGDANTQAGMAAHIYLITKSMVDQHFYNADGEMMFVAQQGNLRLVTEFGRIDIEPGEIAVIPRGVKFRVEIPSGPARGYLCENYGGAFTLPERGPIGANCLANSRDFLTPVAAYEDKDTPTELYVKWGGSLFKTTLPHSPIDVVAWHGNYAPYKYDLRTFSPVGAIGFDHPDPSIFTVLTSPSETAGTANIDFVIFRKHVPSALVPHEHHVRVHGADLRRLRRQAGRFCARWHQPAQHDAAAWSGPSGVRSRQQWRAEAGEADRHHGLHVRDTVSATCHRAWGDDGRVAGRLRRLLEGA